jgi:hypothetical protein
VNDPLMTLRPLQKMLGQRQHIPVRIIIPVRVDDSEDEEV